MDPFYFLINTTVESHAHCSDGYKYTCKSNTGISAVCTQCTIYTTVASVNNLTGLPDECLILLRHFYSSWLWSVGAYLKLIPRCSSLDAHLQVTGELKAGSCSKLFSTRDRAGQIMFPWQCVAQRFSCFLKSHTPHTDKFRKLRYSVSYVQFLLRILLQILYYNKLLWKYNILKFL